MSLTDTTAAGRKGARGPQPPVAVPRQLPLRRRRPAMIGLSLALIVVGALGGAWLYVATGAKSAMLAVARPVPYGAVITDADLTVAHLSTDPLVHSLPAGERAAVVGRRAATELRPGMLLTREQVVTTRLVPDGMQLIGVAVKPSQLPATPLASGQQVLLVATQEDAPAQAPAVASDVQAPPAAPSQPKVTKATVVRVGQPDVQGNTVVDVLVPAGDGPSVARQVAGGHVMIVMQGGA